MVADVYSHIIDDDRRLNAQRFEEQFYQGRGQMPTEKVQAETVPEASQSDKVMLLIPIKSPTTENEKVRKSAFVLRGGSCSLKIQTLSLIETKRACFTVWIMKNFKLFFIWTVKNNQKKLITDAVKFPDFLSIYEEANIMALRINEWKEVCMMAEKRCYTVAELQEILGVSRPTVYSLLKRNEFRWIQLDGGKYRISKKSFDDWLDKQPSEE